MDEPARCDAGRRLSGRGVTLMPGGMALDIQPLNHDQLWSLDLIDLTPPVQDSSDR